jgi:quinolinate synthase
MEKENPEKRFYPASRFALCPNMKYTTPEKILRALEDTVYEIRVPEDIAARALCCIQRMMDG